MSSTELIVGLAGPALQLWLAVAMFRHKSHRRFPIFFAYTIYSVVIITVRLPVAPNPSLFYVVFWITEMIYGALSLLGIGEVLVDALSDQSKQNVGLKLIPGMVLLFLIIASLWRAVYHPLGSTNFWGRLGAGAYSFDFGVLCVDAMAYLLALFQMKPFSGIGQKQHSMAILKGFGIFGLLTLISGLVRTLFGPQFEGWFRYIPPGAYFMATLTWLSAFRHPEPPKVPVLPSPESAGRPTKIDADQPFGPIKKNLTPRPDLRGGAIQHNAGLPVLEPVQNQVVYAHSTIRRDCAGPRLECRQT